MCTLCVSNLFIYATFRSSTELPSSCIRVCVGLCARVRIEARLTLRHCDYSSGTRISRVLQEASVLGPLEFLGGSGALAPIHLAKIFGAGASFCRSTAGRRIFVVKILLIGFGEHLQCGRFCGCGIFGDLQWGVLCRLDITSSELYIVEFKFVGTLRRQDYQSARRGQACDREVCWWQCGAEGRFECERSGTGGCRLQVGTFVTQLAKSFWCKLKDGNDGRLSVEAEW